MAKHKKCEICGSTDDVRLIQHDMVGPANNAEELNDLPDEEYLCRTCREELKAGE